MRKDVFKHMQTLRSIDEIKEHIRVQLELEEQWQTVDGGAGRRRGAPVNNFEADANDGAEGAQSDEGPAAEDMDAFMVLGETHR